MSAIRTGRPRPRGPHLPELLGLQPPSLTGDVYDTFKLMGGFNDDWDLTAGLPAGAFGRPATASPLPGLRRGSARTR